MKNWPKFKTRVSVRSYSSWRFQCTPYMFDFSKNWLRKLQLKNKHIFASDFWQRQVLNMTLYDIPMWSRYILLLSLYKVLLAESLSVSFYGNGCHFSLVPLDMASTVNTNMMPIFLIFSHFTIIFITIIWSHPPNKLHSRLVWFKKWPTWSPTWPNVVTNLTWPWLWQLFFWQKWL